MPPIASSNSLGGIKVGSGLSITNDGTLSTTGGGTVTSVGLTNGTNGGLSISGSPITSSGSITVGHSNVLNSAQTTSAVYPIKIDKNGHISEYGSAVSIPTKVSDLTNDSGFITGITSTDVTTALGYTPYDSSNPSGYTSNTGTVTSIAISNDTNGGLSVSGSPITTNGTISIGHSNVLTSAQTTQAVYPIKIDKNGHISEYGSAVTIPTLKNVFGKVKVGSTTIEADTTQDTLELAAGSNITLTPDATNDKVIIAATDTTYSDFTGATSNTAGTHGLVPAPASGENHKVLFGDADWDSLFLGADVTAQSEQFNLTLCRGNYEDSYTQLSKFPFPAATTHLNGLMSVSDKTKLDGIASGAEVNVNADWDAVSGDAQILNKPTIPSKTSDLTNDSGFITGMTILSYGNSTWQNFIDAYNANKVVYCRASSNSNPASGSQTRLAFMAYVNNATTPTEVEFQYYRSVSTHTASQQGDQVYVYKLNKTNGWTVTVREASVKVAAGTGLGGTYSNGTMTLTGPTKVSDLTNDSGFITLNDIPTTHSIPSGGTIGQILAKNSATDYDVSWADASGGAFIVSFAYDDAIEDGWSCDRTAQEIFEAYESGMAVIGVIPQTSEAVDYDLDESATFLFLANAFRYSSEDVSDCSAEFHELHISPYYPEIGSRVFYVENDTVYSDEGYFSLVPESRTINNKALTSNITLTASDVGAQEPLVSGTNIKTINNQSLLGSGNISVISSGTSVPTANETAEFDSSAKMNSTNMTSSEVTDFVESLDISGGGGGSVPTFNTATITLTTVGWSNNSQTVTVQGVTASNIVIVNPAPASYDEYVIDNVRCTGQSANSLTFTCDFVPDEAITVSVIITSVTAVYGGEVS